MSIIKKIRTWLGLDQQAEAMKQLLDAVKDLKEEKKTAQPTPAVQEPQPGTAPTVVPESGIANEELQQQLQTLTTLNEGLQKQVESLQKQLTTAKEDGVKSLFVDLKKDKDEKDQKKSVGRPRIDGKDMTLRVDMDLYNMLQFLSKRKAIKKTRYMNEKIRKGLMNDLESDPLFSALYNEYNKPERADESEEIPLS